MLTFGTDRCLEWRWPQCTPCHPCHVYTPNFSSSSNNGLEFPTSLLELSLDLNKVPPQSTFGVHRTTFPSATSCTQARIAQVSQPTPSSMNATLKSDFGCTSSAIGLRNVLDGLVASFLKCTISKVAPRVGGSQRLLVSFKLILERLYFRNTFPNRL